MININNIFGLSESALKIRDRRSEVLATNLINADTPNFKARDIDFREAMSSVVGDQSQTLNPTTTNSNHISLAGLDSEQSLKYRVPLQPSLDGNTVDVQTEQAEFTRNALNYQANLNFIDGTIRSIRNALSRE